MFRKIKAALKEFDSTYSILEKIYHLIIVFVIFAFGSVSSFFAYLNPLFTKLGYLGLFVCFLMTSFLTFFIIYLYASSVLLREKSKYYTTLSNIKVDTNPLLENFNDSIIHLEDLRLPEGEPQKNKTFRRCRLVGPLTIGILGGHFESCRFFHTGTTIAITVEGKKQISFPGVLTFENCTFIDCSFVQITIITTKEIAEAFSRSVAGVDVIGIN